MFEPYSPELFDMVYVSPATFSYIALAYCAIRYISKKNDLSGVVTLLSLPLFLINCFYGLSGMAWAFGCRKKGKNIKKSTAF